MAFIMRFKFKILNNSFHVKFYIDCICGWFIPFYAFSNGFV